MTFRRRGSPARASLWSTIDPRALILALGTFAIGTDAFIIGGILPKISHDLYVSVGRAGLVVSVFSLAYAVGSPIVSASTAHLRRPTVLIGGLAVFSAANLMSALSPTLAGLLATRVMAALAAGLVAPACYALASTLGGSGNRGKLLAIVGAGFTSAMVLGVPLGVIISKYTGWRGALIFVAILGAVAALCMWGARVPEPDPTKSAPSLAEQMRILGRPETLIVLTPFLIWSIANFGLYTFIAEILGRLGSSTAVPYLLLLFGAGCMAGNFIGGSLSDRYGPRRPTIFCLGMLICDLAAIQPASSSMAAAAVTMIGWGVCMAALFTLQQQRAIAVNPERSNLILALNNSALYLGASIGAAAGGLVISSVSLAFLAPTSAAVAVSGLVALLLLPRPRAPDTPGPPNASTVLQRGTGADFARLPPDNATGKFVELVQRMPVTIGHDDPQELRQSVSPGMSVIAPKFQSIVNFGQFEERSMSLSRRAFIESGATMIIASTGVASVAWSDSLPMLSESDPLAISLGYKANASAVDAQKFSQYAAGQMCSTCALYQGAAGSSSGPCPIYAGKAVTANGWCASYTKKA